MLGAIKAAQRRDPVPHSDRSPDYQTRVPSRPRTRFEGIRDEHSSGEERRASPENLKCGISKHGDNDELVRASGGSLTHRG